MNSGGGGGKIERELSEPNNQGCVRIKMNISILMMLICAYVSGVDSADLSIIFTVIEINSGTH